MTCCTREQYRLSHPYVFGIVAPHVAVHAAMSDLVDFACGEIVLLGEADVKEAFIVAQI